MQSSVLPQDLCTAAVWTMMPSPCFLLSACHLDIRARPSLPAHLVPGVLVEVKALGLRALAYSTLHELPWPQVQYFMRFSFLLHLPFLWGCKSTSNKNIQQGNKCIQHTLSVFLTMLNVDGLNFYFEETL